MTHVVTVVTGARLHFGLVVAENGAERQYAGVGAMVANPGFTLRMTLRNNSGQRMLSDELFVPAEVAPRVAEFLQRCRDNSSADPVRVEVSRVIPQHVGLGSGTQLALATATAWERITGRKVAPDRLGRGTRSQIGGCGFQRGGMLAYGLTTDAADTWRQPLPDAWRFVLVTPPGREGLSGAAEQATFQSARPMPRKESEALLNLVRDVWWPAAAAGEFENFCAALYEFGCRVGDYFSPQQGGVFAEVRMAALADALRREGVDGIAQTSWGPTIAVACRDAEMAGLVAQRIDADPRWADCTVHVTTVLNRGATVTNS